MSDPRLKAFNILKEVVLKPVEWNNKFVSNTAITEVDRKKFFTSYNEVLNRRIVEIKLSK